MWPVKHGQPYATEIERWMFATLLAALFERVEELKALDIEDPLDEIATTRRFRGLSSEETIGDEKPSSFSTVSMVWQYLTWLNPLYWMRLENKEIFQTHMSGSVVLEPKRAFRLKPMPSI